MCALLANLELSWTLLRSSRFRTSRGGRALGSGHSRPGPAPGPCGAVPGGPAPRPRGSGCGAARVSEPVRRVDCPESAAGSPEVRSVGWSRGAWGV